jgi:hypothetical protein
MTIIPTLEGGLRIDTEEEMDWRVFRILILDAMGKGTDLASRLGDLISEDAGAEDWKEYVVPDLREAFHDEINQVATAIESASFQANEGAGPLWITPADGYAWYSTLNQARLALEELHHFGANESISLDENSQDRHTAFLRSRFYCAIQSLLLEHVLR